MAGFVTTAFVIISLTIGHVFASPSSLGLCERFVTVTTRNFERLLSGIQDLGLELNVMCPELKRFQSHTEQCMHILEGSPIERAIIRSFQYICEPSRRQKLEMAASSGCLKDGELFSRVDGVTDLCFDLMVQGKFGDAMFDSMMTEQPIMSKEFCPFVEQAVSCVTERVGEFCDVTMVDFVKDISLIGLYEMTHQYVPLCFPAES